MDPETLYQNLKKINWLLLFIFILVLLIRVLPVIRPFLEKASLWLPYCLPYPYHYKFHS